MINRNFVKKINTIILVFLFMGLSFINLTAGEDFAKKVKLPKNMANRSMWETVVKNWKVPSKGEVGLPAYPGSFIIGVKGMSHMTANGKKYTTLPNIVLATTAEQKKVLKFYQEKLKDWHYKNDMDMFEVFWKGKGKFNSLDITQTATMVNIILMKANIPYTEYMPDAKTVITIVYKPIK